MSPLASGTLGIGAMLLLVFAGTPVGVAMGVVGFVGFAAIAGLDPALAMLGLARVPLRERVVALRRVWPVLGLFVLVMGGMYVGVFTATEAAAVGAAGAFLLALA